MFLPPASGHMAEVEGEVAFLDLERLAVMEGQKLVVVEVQKGLAVKEVQKLERMKIQIPVNKYLINSQHNFNTNCLPLLDHKFLHGWPRPVQSSVAFHKCTEIL